MTTYGFHASHEQISPGRLLRDVQQAERAGFRIAMCSDHFSPWSTRQGHSGFAWSWLGAALATTEMTFGTVCAPGQRYHPAVVAQSSATLAEMFPDRFWVALGSGQNMNEHITGDKWPDKSTRQARLEESVDIIRRLHRGEEVTHHGLVDVESARVYSLPETPPRIMGPALTPETAARAAHWADGLITINDDPDSVRQIIRSYRTAGGRGTLALQVHVAIEDTMSRAREVARDQWQNHAVDPPVAYDLPTPEEFDLVARYIPDEKIEETVIVTDSVDHLVGRLREFEQLGFDEIYLHHVSQDQAGFLELAEQELLPALARG
ncbi:TIGR03885 family FMN-dependent LLM class oxidoreductase [Dietzia sp. SLG310A2-38A2]|uniref:TIGR03885 family FMN-dependent LLM class oxidoreductase n=1 Tax=Dietzia sp. SLG310A2-38A2 TaxID=1630643 RepID=UPI0015F82ED9|nr:TIGR03885 family FMN-dependent LLM class oxidoreductase [Dietzia sp. SLG310A2-38A2]MBB1031084.1 TIGR03885 family FMN-dependent LLM class oxidoreductase [Dietzia sp. SLG310A2-38A2]